MSMNERLINQISDILLDVAYDYHNNFDDWTTSDFQGYCMAEAIKIMELLE